jgi:hypothetical protein
MALRKSLILSAREARIRRTYDGYPGETESPPPFGNGCKDLDKMIAYRDLIESPGPYPVRSPGNSSRT